jgi:hypothetical protein
MSVRPSIHQRSSGDPVVFGDIPSDIVRKALVLLTPSDLISARLVCRGWNPTAQDVMTSRLRVGAERKEKIVCGLHLRRLVGFDNFTIKTLELTVIGSALACVLDIIYHASPTLSSLKVEFNSLSSICYYALRVISIYCSALRRLHLTGFDFGPSTADQDDHILKVVEIGFRRLTRLDLIRCRGNIVSFIDLANIPELQAINYTSRNESPQESEEVISAVAEKYPTLISMCLDAEFHSSIHLKGCGILPRLGKADIPNEEWGFGVESIGYPFTTSFETSGD